jgi:phage FluMu protein Com
MATLFKFRCYQCNKLLGAPASKIGRIIHCPKCGAELIVPLPDDEEAASDSSEGDEFRLEDLGLRLEPERLVEPPPTIVPHLAIDPSLPDPIAFLESEAVNAPEPSPDATGEEPPPIEGLPETPDPAETPLVPGSRRRGRSILAEPVARRRDVILPRTAAVAWALFALLGMAFAFTTGLLVGHFLWK